MKTLHYDNFHVAPGTKKEMYCKVCSTRMDFIPYDPEKYKGIGMSGALAKFWYNYDEFVCPNSELDWHIKAVKLLIAIDETPSPSLKAIMQKDYEQMIR